MRATLTLQSSWKEGEGVHMVSVVIDGVVPYFCQQQVS